MKVNGFQMQCLFVIYTNNFGQFERVDHFILKSYGNKIYIIV